MAYDLAGAFYDRRTWMEFWRRNEKPLVLEALGNGTGRRILDIGCGTGFYAIDLVEAGNEVCGVDISLGMIEQLKCKLHSLPGSLRKSLWVLYADGEKLPVKDKNFDACIVIRTLSHIENFQMVFDELWRVLKSNGALVIADLHSEHVYDDTKLEDPDSSREIRVLTYKRPPGEYIQALKQRGFYEQKYEEITYNRCLWRPRGHHNFEELRMIPDNPIFFVSSFRKTV